MSWDVDKLGRTIFPSCPQAHWMKTLFSCHLCPLDTFREADLVRFPNSSEEAHLRGGECLRCPPNSVAGYMNTTIASCLCMRGYYYARSSNTSATSVHNTSRAETCVMCPPIHTRTQLPKTRIARCVPTVLSLEQGLWTRQSV